MAVLARNKNTGMFLVRGKDEFEIYWVADCRNATKFQTKQEAADYLQSLGLLWRTEVVEKMEIITPKISDFLTVWYSLAEQGFCDSAHSAEYYRIVREWVKSGKPENITEFIKGSANKLPE